MSAHRRKSHGMITRLDKSLGLNLSTDDCLSEHFDHSERVEVPEVVAKKPKPNENSPVTVGFSVPSPARHAGISFSNTLHVSFPSE
ncbi:unnamed protein product [Dicrocoelium dendriticum]|nr:unnamed protein product [Dicrocoelium dendriticum]